MMPFFSPPNSAAKKNNHNHLIYRTGTAIIELNRKLTDDYKKETAMTDKTIQYPIRIKYLRQPHRGNAVTDTALITDENDLLEYAYAFLRGDKSEMDCGRVADERSSINNAIAENEDDDEFVAEEKSKLAELETGGDDHPFYIYTGGAGEGYRYDFFRTALQLLRAAAAYDHQFAEIEILGEGDAAFDSEGAQ